MPAMSCDHAAGTAEYRSDIRPHSQSVKKFHSINCTYPINNISDFTPKVNYFFAQFTKAIIS